MQNQLKIFIFTALPCEAKALISRLQLKKNVLIKPFAVYSNAEICLVVTGPGKSAMAAGVAYSQALFNDYDCPVLLNLGIAGHKESQLGQLFIADKITDAESGRNFYPALLFDLPCKSAKILSVAKPETHYQQPCLYDMEASAFYETAIRFSTSEIIQSIKVISDNQSSPAEQINARQVDLWMSVHIDTLLDILKQLQGLAQIIQSREPVYYRHYSEQWHFTVSQKHKLKELLSRWEVLSDGEDPHIDMGMVNSKAVLATIAQKISGYDFTLSL